MTSDEEVYSYQGKIVSATDDRDRQLEVKKRFEERGIDFPGELELLIGELGNGKKNN